jgi:alanyl-tRNA synthetase
MTERLYYTDSYRTRFSARVVERATWEGRPAVLLDCTAFYPTSGGQPADRGTLDGVAVADVTVREEDGAILHVLSLPSGDLVDFSKPEGSEVEGEVDWPRRFDHMQQHTGQHVLSAAFEQLLGGDTVGFHLGAETCTVDINIARLEPERVVPVEELANRVVWENRPLSIRFVEPGDQAAVESGQPLSPRGAAVVRGPVRIVEIADFDLNPCGGTHVARTGEIGLIKIVRLDYRGDDTRVEFLCGARALRDYRAKNDMVARVAGLLTVGYWELDQAVERLQAEAKQSRHDLRRVHKRLLEVEASELVGAAPVASLAGRDPYHIVFKIWGRSGSDPEKPPGEMRALAQELMQRPGVVALLFDIGERTHVCFSRAEDVDLDVAALLRDACTQLGGRGGGQPNLAQGSAPTADVDRVEAALASALSSLGLSVS